MPSSRPVSSRASPSLHLGRHVGGRGRRGGRAGTHLCRSPSLALPRHREPRAPLHVCLTAHILRPFSVVTARALFPARVCSMRLFSPFPSPRAALGLFDAASLASAPRCLASASCPGLPRLPHPARRRGPPFFCSLFGACRRASLARRLGGRLKLLAVVNVDGRVVSARR